MSTAFIIRSHELQLRDIRKLNSYVTPELLSSSNIVIRPETHILLDKSETLVCVNKLPVCSLMPGHETIHTNPGVLKPTKVVMGAGWLISCSNEYV
jgi:hypothetical protein